VEADTEASITEVRTLIVSETEARATALQLANARIDTAEQATEAEVLHRQQAVAGEAEARAEDLGLVTARIDGLETDTAAEILRLDTADADETSARGAALLLIDARLDGVDADLSAAVTDFGEAIADEAGARATDIGQVEAAIGDVDGRVTDLRSVTVSPDGAVESKAMMVVNAAGKTVGWTATNDGRTGIMDMEFDSYVLRRPNGAVLLTNDGDRLILPEVEVNTLTVNTAMVPMFATSEAYVSGSYASLTGVAEPRQAVLTGVAEVKAPGWIRVDASFQQGFPQDAPWSATIAIGGVEIGHSIRGGGKGQDSVQTQAFFYADAAGDYPVSLMWAGHTSTTLRERTMFGQGFSATE
jgi:hypothetical protein